MNHIRYELLRLKNKKVKIKNKDKILQEVNKLLTGTKFGVLLLSEVDKKGNDKIKTLAINCDIIHSREIVKCLLEKLPGLKEELETINDNKSFEQMIS
jgi:hypothetical protein